VYQVGVDSLMYHDARSTKHELYIHIYIKLTLTSKQTVPWLRPLVTGKSPRRLCFDPNRIYMGFVVDKVAMGLVFLRVLRVSPVAVIPSMFLTNHHRLQASVTRSTRGGSMGTIKKQLSTKNRKHGTERERETLLLDFFVFKYLIPQAVGLKSYTFCFCACLHLRMPFHSLTPAVNKAADFCS
jgi:hypothetical protein